ncbi:MAG: hypothetical protein KIS96_15475 [Bauldia sp.]|nr:hypothetical protein [Bauldia sp.]
MTARKPGGFVLVFMPALIAVLGLSAILLGVAPRPTDIAASGYGIDEIETGAITAETP